jgi:hypothetical protein
MLLLDLNWKINFNKKFKLNLLQSYWDGTTGDPVTENATSPGLAWRKTATGAAGLTFGVIVTTGSALKARGGRFCCFCSNGVLNFERDVWVAEEGKYGSAELLTFGVLSFIIARGPGVVWVGRLLVDWLRRRDLNDLSDGRIETFAPLLDSTSDEIRLLLLASPVM